MITIQATPIPTATLSSIEYENVIDQPGGNILPHRTPLLPVIY